MVLKKAVSLLNSFHYFSSILFPMFFRYTEKEESKRGTQTMKAPIYKSVSNFDVTEEESTAQRS